MTRTWCPTCLDNCTDHPQICTICGDTLTLEPSSSSETVQQHSNRNPAGNRRQNLSPDNTMLMAAMMQQQDVSLGINGAGAQIPINNEVTEGLGEWQTIPANVLDPAQSVNTSSKPTAQKYLDSIPRIKLEKFSAVLHEATVEFDSSVLGKGEGGDSTKSIFPAMVSDFKPHPPFSVSGPLILSPSLYGSKKGTATVQKLPRNSILFMKRGGNVTFVQKTNYAASIGASAVICWNHVDVWPYIMKDSKGEASAPSNTSNIPTRIPIVIVKESDGQIIKSILNESRSQLTQLKVKVDAQRLKGEDHTCVICKEDFKEGEMLMRLPHCNHFFHEDCACLWLKSHNTCPFCRRELPAESHDEGGEMDIERRRRNNQTRDIRGMEDELFG